MGDIDKISLVEGAGRGNLSTGLQRIPSHHELIRVNKLLLAVICALMAVVLIAGYMLLPSDSFLNRYKNATVTEAYAVEMNPVLSAEVNALKGQLVGLVSGSIESKLNALEESIRVGSVSSSIGAIEDLKKDIKVLRSYSAPVEKGKDAVSNEQLMQEMSHLKRLIYLTLASCGLMFAAVGGIWIKNRYRLPYNEIKIRYLGKD
jgi:hypothetical protein